ncbi:GNAT family N-acetyltransferase [Lentzea tibetensis]|uniref:GNAT family N-acetyltransferase n=1 Tax=Lentzea tibetensis TaxID=2591470 RepID=A0A563EIV9_9PSEU|nr:GNAT family N-acetyltransferase [Lentzea tibetensis]TWP46525.1 GNAT family N-acetyltransferase [Lentzea tibetensis]
MWETLEEFYDAVPRHSARVEEHGSLVLFVQAHEGGWPLYARPRFPGGEPTVDDVAEMRARQRELGVPEAFEWVHETTPGLLEAAEQAGLSVLRAPLLVLDPHLLPPADDERVRVLDEAPEVLGVVGRLAFSVPGTEKGELGTAERDAELTGAAPEPSMNRHAAAELPGHGVVAVGTAQRAGDVVEIAGVGTLPAARRQGLGGAITAALAHDALDRGAKIVFVSAGSETIAQVYERVGFRRVGTACIAEPG